MPHDPLDLERVVRERRHAHRRDLLRLLGVDIASLLLVTGTGYAYWLDLWSMPRALLDFRPALLTTALLYLSLNIGVIFAHLATLFADVTPVRSAGRLRTCNSPLDHRYRRDGDAVVCTRCAERLPVRYPDTPSPIPKEDEPSCSD